jgi:hypothetical protein
LAASTSKSAMWRRIGAVLEVELVLAGLLDRHREDEALLLRALRDVGAELLVDEHAGRVRVDAALHRAFHALEDQPLGVGDRSISSGWDRPGSRTSSSGTTPVVEGQDVELAVIAECHGRYPVVVLK